VKVNEARKRKMGRKVLHELGDSPRGKTVALLGLTFKPNTDDMRDAPSIAIATTLADAGVTVRAHDPEGMAMAKTMMPDLTYCADPYEAATGADAVVIVTEWDAFRALDLPRLKRIMATPVLVDLRNVYNRATVEAAGFTYSAIGR
jgi:UDPglucose 6-dehydrogenase